VKIYTKPEKYIPKMLILVNLTARFNVSPLKPVANNFTIGVVNNIVVTTNIVHNRIKIFTTLLVNSIAFSSPSFTFISLSIGIYPVLKAEPTKANKTIGIVNEIKYASVTLFAPKK
jgi:hypothetical protein